MSSQGNPIRLAVLGAGYWGSKLAHEYASIEDSVGSVKLSCIADISKPALDTVSSLLNRETVNYSSDFKHVLHNEKIDAVHVALPNELHYEAARAALHAGKHVLLEKPMAISSREAFKLATQAEEGGLVLQVGHIFRFNNAVRAVKEILKDNTLGKAFYANLIWTAYMPPPRARDIVFDLAPHPIDVLNFLLDEWPTGIDAIGESFLRRKPGEEEVAFINLEFPDLFLANVYLSWIQHGAKERKVLVVCENGTIDCDALNQSVRILRHERPDGSEEKIDVAYNNTIRSMEMHFLERIRGRGPQFNSAMIGAQTVQVLENVTSVMRARRTFQVHQVPAGPIFKRKEIQAY